MAKSYADWWIEFYGRDVDYYAREAKGDPFEDWDELVAVEAGAKGYLTSALFVGLAGGDQEVVSGLAKNAIAVGKRAIEEKRVSRSLNSVEWNRAICLAAMAMAEAFLTGKLDAEKMSRAVSDLEIACAEKRKERWDDINQAEHLQAVRLALLAEDFEAAARILRSKRSYKNFVDEHAFWSRLLEISPSGRPVRDGEFSKAFRRYFNKVRNPRYDSAGYTDEFLLRLELGLLCEKFLYAESDVLMNLALDRIRGEP